MWTIETKFPTDVHLPTDVIRTIRDPEKPNTLEELDVVTEKCVEVQDLGDDEYLIIIKFSPTVPHCSLATLIGAYERYEERSFTHKGVFHVLSYTCYFSFALDL